MAVHALFKIAEHLWAPEHLRTVMLRNLTWALLAAAMTGAARADDIAAARMRMAEALGRLADTGKFTITTSGEEKVGETIRALQVSTALEFSNIGGIPTVKAEQIVLRDGAIVHRLAADGSRLWVWDPFKKEYASISYQVSQGDPREDYLRTMIFNFVKWSPREASFNSRLLQEAFLTPNQSERWTPWTGPSNVTMQDNQITCEALSGNPSMVRYYVTKPDEYLPFELTGANIYRQEKLNTGWYESNLTMQMYYDALPDDTDFTFTPPAGAKPRVISARQAGN